MFFSSRQAFPFPHQVIAYGNGLDVHSTRQVQPWHLGPASFAGTPTTRIGLGRASASADNNPTGNKASPPQREWRVGQNDPGVQRFARSNNGTRVIALSLVHHSRIQNICARFCATFFHKSKTRRIAGAAFNAFRSQGVYMKT